MLSCLFYEEVQLYLDIRNKNLNRSRLTRLLVYLPLQVAFILFFGWQKYLFVFLGMRIVGFSGWIVFHGGFISLLFIVSAFRKRFRRCFAGFLPL